MSDNTDHDTATTDEKNTHHIHESIAIANVSFANISVGRQSSSGQERGMGQSTF